MDAPQIQDYPQALPKAGTRVAAVPLVALFAATMFVSATLLFWVQPMVSKMVLPLLGGSPGVWNTAMVFFQGTLLAGYAFAHLGATYLGVKRQAIVHVIVLCLGLFSCPIALATGWVPPADGSPALWLILALAATVGLPFFALSANAPTLQRWFAQCGHRDSDNPYFLYGASNLGSILALVLYPFVAERFLTLGGQSWAWTATYVGLIALAGLCAVTLWRHGGTAVTRAPTTGRTDLAWLQRLRWTALAFIPSALLLGVTSHITTDIASAPLLWVGPLILYLLSFVFVFARRPMLRHSWMLKVQLAAIALLPVALLPRPTLGMALVLHLSIFFVTAMVFHGELARQRPPADRLTEFYLWMSLGGVLGGLFTALLAPMVFSGVYEYPLLLALSCLARPGGWRLKRADFAIPAGFAALVAVPFLLEAAGITDGPERFQVVALILAATVLLYKTGHRPARLAMVCGVALAGLSLMMQTDTTLDRSRSFFGVYRVGIQQAGGERLHYISHGTTLHGIQRAEGPNRLTETSYFNRSGPIGQLFQKLDAGLAAGRPIRSVGVVGLGIGTLACYGRPGQDWTFFEIDPLVEAIARDDRYFTYLRDCPVKSRVVLGDGRLKLQAVADGGFDILVADAFSSDAVPVHLMTREALGLYLSKLAPDGVLAINISNRVLRLEPIVARLVADAGLRGWAQNYKPDDATIAAEVSQPSQWVVVTRDGPMYDRFAGDKRWRPLSAPAGTPLWTDDFSNIVSAIDW